MSDCEQFLEKIIAISEDKKASDVITYHIDDEGWLSEYVVIVSVSNVIHGKAVFSALVEETKPLIKALDSSDFYEHSRSSGMMTSGWVIIDFNSILVHCLTSEVREYYQLDLLFSKYGMVCHHKT